MLSILVCTIHCTYGQSFISNYISTEDALKNIGDTVRVEAVVDSFLTETPSKVSFLIGRRNTAYSLMVTIETGYRYVRSVSYKQYILGKIFYATGKMVLYKGVPNLIVTKNDKWGIAEIVIDPPTPGE